MSLQTMLQMIYILFNNEEEKAEKSFSFWLVVASFPLLFGVCVCVLFLIAHIFSKRLDIGMHSISRSVRNLGWENRHFVEGFFVFFVESIQLTRFRDLAHWPMGTYR
jgi:hypothetical protein